VGRTGFGVGEMAMEPLVVVLNESTTAFKRKQTESGSRVNAN
jgi:hypothetical protein